MLVYFGFSFIELIFGYGFGLEDFFEMDRVVWVGLVWIWEVIV